MPQTPEETSTWHKRFGAQCNNRAWELSTAQRTRSEDQEMLHAAHGSAWHWSTIGTELNHMRATMCLAEVHALLGHGAIAIAYAREMRGFFLARETDDWELALTHAIHAHAAAVAGEAQAHRASYEAAVVALAAIKDKEEREIVEKTFAHVPIP